MDAIIEYLTKNCGRNEYSAQKYVERLKAYDDLVADFLEYIKTGAYRNDAKTLHAQLPYLEPDMIFELLVGLREEPEVYQQYIDDRFRNSRWRHKYWKLCFL